MTSSRTAASSMNSRLASCRWISPASTGRAAIACFSRSTVPRSARRDSRSPVEADSWLTAKAGWPASSGSPRPSGPGRPAEPLRFSGSWSATVPGSSPTRSTQSWPTQASSREDPGAQPARERYAERFLLAARTEVTDRVLIFGRRHLRSVLAERDDPAGGDQVPGFERSPSSSPGCRMRPAEILASGGAGRLG